jgi:hypothetical protein
LPRREKTERAGFKNLKKAEHSGSHLKSYLLGRGGDLEDLNLRPAQANTN